MAASRVPSCPMRTFIAVPFADKIRGAYQTLYERGRSLHPGLRWVAPENLHLTLRFLGETDPERVEPLRTEVGAEVAQYRPFCFTLGNPGHFSGGRGSALRVLWFGVRAGENPLAGLAKRIEGAVRRCGFPRERGPWRAHLTVARNPQRSPSPLSAAEWKRLGLDCGLAGLSAKVENIVLLESELRPEGPLYSSLWEARLGASGMEK